MRTLHACTGLDLDTSIGLLIIKTDFIQLNGHNFCLLFLKTSAIFNIQCNGSQ